MTALLIEDVTLTKGDEITINIRFRGGLCKTMTIPAPIRECDRLRTSPDIVAQIDTRLSVHTDG